jgi:hypothetical protein
MFGFNFTVCTYFSHVTIPRANKEFNWINNTVSRPVPPSIDSGVANIDLSPNNY